MFGGERGAAAVTNFSSENEGLQHVVIQLVGWAEERSPTPRPLGLSRLCLGKLAGNQGLRGGIVGLRRLSPSYGRPGWRAELHGPQPPLFHPAAEQAAEFGDLPTDMLVLTAGEPLPVMREVHPVQAGIPWLSFVVFPTRRHATARKVVQASRRPGERYAAWQAGEISFADFDATGRWTNHVRHADSWGLRRHVLEPSVF